jgi:hypothetical protein
MKIQASDILRLEHWEQYNEDKLKKNHSAQDQTSRFFLSIPYALYANQFLNTDSSQNNIIHIGASDANFIRTLYPECISRYIAYDFSKIAVDNNNRHGILTKLVDINAIDDNNHLEYHSLLKSDLSSASAIIMIRILEYLNQEALTLLLFFLMNNAPKGISFYIENCCINNKDTFLNNMSNFINQKTICPKERQLMEKNFFTIMQMLKTGYIASFFGPRTDISFDFHQIKQDEFCNHFEQLVVRKI